MPLLLTVALLAAHLPFAAALTVFDVREHRLPNRLVLWQSTCVAAVSLVAAALLPAVRAALPASILVAFVLGGGAVCLALLVPSALGMGDAKVAFATALVTCLLGGAVIVSALLWFCAASAVGAVVALVRSRGDFSSRFAFGPVILSVPYGGLLVAALLAGTLP